VGIETGMEVKRTLKRGGSPSLPVERYHTDTIGKLALRKRVNCYLERKFLAASRIPNVVYNHRTAL
jgi:hypothetical protein